MTYPYIVVTPTNSHEIWYLVVFSSMTKLVNMLPPYFY